jgi:hypothetical protein
MEGGADRKRKRMTFWMDHGQVEGLKRLSSATRIKQADYIREGIDMVLAKYAKELKRAKEGGG